LEWDWILEMTLRLNFWVSLFGKKCMENGKTCKIKIEYFDINFLCGSQTYLIKFRLNLLFVWFAVSLNSFFAINWKPGKDRTQLSWRDYKKVIFL